MGDESARILGQDPATIALREQIQRLAGFDARRSPHLPTILVQGETGAGKGLVARVLHDAGLRADGPFIDVNCAAIPESMLEAELFGFEAGAFTDARRAKPGLFEAAAGGTLFLDEIDSLPLLLQSKLLKAIEEKRVRRLGAVSARQVDVKLVAASQSDLARMVGLGGFRADLYHRLAVVVLTLAPLRERRADILLLARHYLAEYTAAYGVAAKRLRDDAERWLEAHGWPGNVRELSHLMERVVLLCPDAEVDAAALAGLCAANPLLAPTDVAPTPPARTGLARAAAASSAVKQKDRQSRREAAELDGGAAEAGRIEEALRCSGGNVVAAARLLGIGRNALRHRMRRHGIERPTLEDLARRAPLAARDARPLPHSAATGAPAAPSESPTATGSRAARPSRRLGPADEAGARGAEATAWERRTVAVLAIDLAFRTAEGADPAPEPWTMASRWERLIQERVSGFGGAFLRQSPSRATVVFGVPLALEQMPQRAVRAAFAIRRLTGGDPLERGAGAAPEIRLALHLGAAHVATGTRELGERLLPVGDTLALPERLLGHAGNGEILVSSRLARRVATTFGLEARELRVGPNPDDVLLAYAAAAPATSPGIATSSAADSVASPFIGRERELEQLCEAFASAAAGSGQVVFVVGEAGIGKSRLIQEMHRRVAPAAGQWLEGRCASYGTTTAFLPIVDALQRYCGIEDRDDEASAGAKIERAVADLGGDIGWTLPFVRHVLSLPAADAATQHLDSASRRSETMRALRALLLQAAERQPLLVVIEDLHWCDPASEECLAFLADSIAAARVLLVCSHRPGYRQPFGDRSYHARLTLKPLSQGETTQLTDAVLAGGHAPDEVKSLIARKAEGNPLFIEELSKALLEDGTLRRDGDRVVVARDLDERMVPDSIQDLLGARLDRLAFDARRAIQVASVIGREFALRLLERIAEAGDSVRSQIDELRAVELIYEKARHPELAYMFKHALTHDVAYASIVAERRRALHCTIGLAVEELYADRLAEHYETLAHHFTLGEDWPRALEYHERAAHKAAESFANRAVIDHGRQALTIAQRLGASVPAERREALAGMVALACFYVSEFKASEEAYVAAAAVAQEGTPRSLYLSHAAFSALWAGGPDRSLGLLDEAEAANRISRDAGADALTLHVRGFGRGVRGDVDFYERAANEAFRRSEAAGDEPMTALVGFSIAQVSEWIGDYRRSLEVNERVVLLGRKHRLAHLVIWPLWFMGKAACCLGDYARAIAQLTEGAEICDRIGDRAWKCRLLNTLGWCLAEIGAYARAREVNLAATQLAHQLGDAELIANCEINLAVDALMLGDAGRASSHLEPVLEGLDGPNDWMRWRYSLHVFDTLARLELERGQPDRALELATRELDGARRYRAPKLEARALELRGRSLLALEARPEAAQALAAAIDAAGAIAYPRTAWQAGALLAEVKRRDGRIEEARLAAGRARTLIDSLAHGLPENELRRSLRAAAGELVA